MASVVVNPPLPGRGVTAMLRSSKWQASQKPKLRRAHLLYSETQPSHSSEDKNRIYKELGLHTLKRKIEDAVARAEILAPTALEHEEARRNRREELLCEYDLFDDPSRSSEALLQLADSVKVVDILKDLKYKVEEAKLITELADVDAVNYRLFKQAYNASLDFCKSLDQYEMSKLLTGSYDMQGASLTIKAQEYDAYSEIWAEQLVNMYIKWAEKQGHRGRISEKYSSTNDGTMSATLEFEFEYAYGHLLGESGVHRIITSRAKPSVAAVDVTPLLLNMSPDMDLPDGDLMITSDSSRKSVHGQIEHVIRVEHVPTGLFVHSSGERSHMANKIKALNRLKAKLLVILCEQRASCVSDIRKCEIMSAWKQETRRYIFHPQKFVKDLKTGVELADLSSVLDGNIEPLIESHINVRQGQ